MVRLPGFRPPQFSEEDTWLPCWLQRCNGEWLDVESMQEDHTTFEQRLEEFMDIDGGDPLTEKGGCSIGQLFISGTDSSPFSCAQSAKDVVHFHLCLSSDGDTQNTALSNDACETEPTYPVLAPHGTLEIQKDTNLSTFVDVDAVNCSQTVELDPDKKIEQLKLDDSVSFSEAASDAVELCIAASEALVINELIYSDLLEKSSSASAILEASLQLKQARLEVCKNTFADSLSVISDTDNLSDLDDITMESVYEDAGVHLIELSQNELSVSQVKDTLESEYDELLDHKKTSASARMFNSSGDYNLDNDLHLRKNMTAKYSGSDAEKMVVHNQLCDGGTEVGHCNDSLRVVIAQANSHPSVSAEEVNRLTSESNPHESHVSSSPIMSFRDEERDNCQSNMDIVKERFQSRWFGGWSSSNEVKCATTKCRIPEPFVGQTSFLSESACTAPDANSFVQKQDKQATVASQVSIHNENFPITTNDRTLLSQEAGSSSAPFEDPLCSFVPSSIPENLCSSPILNYRDPVHPITVDYKKDNVLVAPSSYCILAEEEKIVKQTADNSDKGTEVYRRSASLKDYSVLFPSHIELPGNDCHQKCSFLAEKNSKLTCQETNSLSREEAVGVGAKLQVLNREDSFHGPSPVPNQRTESHIQASTSSKHSLAEENPIGEQPENMAKYLPSEKTLPKLLQCENRSAPKLPVQKRVRFSERETNIPDNKKVRQSQTASKPCYSSRAAKRFTRSSAHLEPRAQQVDRFLRVTLDKKRKRLIFQNMEFLLTGFSQQKEKEIDGLIRKYGGKVLSQIPSANSKGKRSSRDIVLFFCLALKNLAKSYTTTEIQSFKFLYGCAVSAYVLRVNWLIDSIAAGSVLQPNRYMILPRNICRNDQIYTAVKYNTHSLVFNNLGVMLHGNAKYFANFTTIIKHGGGQVFKTLQGLVQSRESGKISMAVLVAEEESCASRHLRHCAMQQNIHVTSVYWIIKCLYAGKIIPSEEKGNPRCPPDIELQRCNTIRSALEFINELYNWRSGLVIEVLMLQATSILSLETSLIRTLEQEAAKAQQISERSSLLNIMVCEK